MRFVKLMGLLVSLLATASVAGTMEYTLDTTKSQVKWTGKKVTGSHWGLLKFKSGKLHWDGTKPVAGEFTVDMASLTVEDMPKADENNGKLLGHLQSDDFFSTKTNPTATFVVKSATPKGPGQFSLQGDLTIKGKTHPITLDTKIATTTTGTLDGQGKLVFDRSKYEIKYNSKTFFDPKTLGDKMIYDEVELELNLTAGNPKAVAM